jgi:hypothetical protein
MPVPKATDLLKCERCGLLERFVGWLIIHDVIVLQRVVEGGRG